ncbi:unnamed protein product [Cylicocyclus nassatus]|uniref:Uncharacterized protein n=1 Tax=Cylicocyclus nassatus TaxID=53992 RepID=A0AA36MGF5_CYLNA|nr:unnamed protein product [Cylicocyclus nassatus]
MANNVAIFLHVIAHTFLKKEAGFNLCLNERKARVQKRSNQRETTSPEIQPLWVPQKTSMRTTNLPDNICNAEMEIEPATMYVVKPNENGS